MLNQVMLVGRIDSISLEEEQLVLSVSKHYKNEEGVYDYVLVPCLIGSNLFNTTKEYCSKDDLVGVRGSLEVKDDKLYVLAERITILRSKSE